MTGTEIKRIIKEKGVKIWQVADKFGVADTTFSKYLRKEFNEEDSNRILNIINELAKEC